MLLFKCVSPLQNCDRTGSENDTGTSARREAENSDVGAISSFFFPRDGPTGVRPSHHTKDEAVFVKNMTAPGLVRVKQILDFIIGAWLQQSEHQ